MSGTHNSVVGNGYQNLLDMDWRGIPSSSYVLKCRFYDDGYILIASSFMALYGEIVDEQAIYERFTILNPYAEMLPKVILKYVKESVRRILCWEEGGIPRKITLVNGLLTIWHEIVVEDMRFLFNYELKLLSSFQYFIHMMKPTLLRSLDLKEENTSLRRKVQDMEENPNSSFSSASGGMTNFRGIHSAIKERIEPTQAFMEAFLYLQNDKTFLPKSSQVPASASPPKGVNSSSSTASLVTPKVSNIAPGSILYEDYSEIKTGSQNESKKGMTLEKNIETKDKVPPQNAPSGLMDASNFEKVVEENSPDEIKIKCYNFFCDVILWAVREKTSPNAIKLIQDLIDGVIEPEEFSVGVARVLHSRTQPLLVNFLKVSLPHLRQALTNGEFLIKEIRPPPVAASLPSPVPTTQREDSTSSSSPSLEPSSAKKTKIMKF